MKTFLEAVEALVEAGWGQHQAFQAAVDLLPAQLNLAGVSDEPQIDEAALEQVINRGPSPLTVEGTAQLIEDRPGSSRFFSPEARGKDLPASIQDEVPEATDAEIEAFLAFKDDSIQFTQEHADTIAETDPDITTRIDQVVIEITAFNATQAPFNWVYEFVAVGSLDENVALIELYEFLVEGKAIPMDTTLTDDEIVAKVRDTLARGQRNTQVFDALKDWGAATETNGVPNYSPLVQFDGFDNIELAAIKQLLTVDRARAIQISRIAEHAALEPFQLAKLWKNFGFKEGQTFAVTAAEAESGELRDFKVVRRSLGDIAQIYKQGLVRYDGSEVLATIHISDSGLAARFRADPYNLDSSELRKALDFLGGGDDFGPSNAQVNWIKERLAGGFQASAPIDKEAMRNAVQILADGWNLAGTEGVLALLTADLVSSAVARAEAQLPNPFGPLKQGTELFDVIEERSAHVKARLRETPEYQELFAHLAPGEAEEEFVRRFENRSQEILGDDVVGVVRNAMRTGNVNTIFQQAQHTDVGESSTRFQEIVARNAQIFRDML